VITESFSNPNSIYVGGRYVPNEDDCEDDENGDCEPLLFQQYLFQRISEIHGMFQKIYQK